MTTAAAAIPDKRTKTQLLEEIQRLTGVISTDALLTNGLRQDLAIRNRENEELRSALKNANDLLEQQNKALYGMQVTIEAHRRVHYPDFIEQDQSITWVPDGYRLQNINAAYAHNEPMESRFLAHLQQSIINASINAPF